MCISERMRTECNKSTMTSDVDDLVIKVYTFWDLLLILFLLAISGANAIGSDGAKSARQYPTDSESSVLGCVTG